MDHYLFLARNVTAAQRMREALAKGGIRCAVQRAPTGLSKQGCSYALRIGTAHYREALALIRPLGLDPFGIFLYVNGTYREVTP